MENRSRFLLHPGRQIAGLNQLFNFSKISAVFVGVSMMVMLMLVFVFMCMSRMGVLVFMRAMIMVFMCMSFPRIRRVTLLRPSCLLPFAG